MAKLTEVFGISNSIPTYTYVDRLGLDGRFAYLLAADRHIVIYGASKQGKTSLRRKVLPESQSVIVPCKPDHSLEDLYAEVRLQLGVGETTQVKKGTTGSVKASGDIKSKAGIPMIAEGQVGGSLEGKLDRVTETTSRPPSDANSLTTLSQVIRDSRRRLIIEDFHYLSEEQRQRLAFDLKALWDLGVFVIIIGVWAEQNLLTMHNNDLSGRVEEIDVQWSDADLDAVLTKGEVALNMIFDDPIKREVIRDAAGNVGLLQRYAERICFNRGILETEFAVRTVDDIAVVAHARDEICRSQENRYHTFIELIGKGFKDPERTKLKMYHHLVRVCFQATDSELLAGIDRQVLLAQDPGVRGRRQHERAVRRVEPAQPAAVGA